VERIPYELCVLTALREAIRRREIWVVGAARWRDPESDLPPDFELNRDVHYAAIWQPLEATAFVDELRTRLGQALMQLAGAMKSGQAGVHIVRRRGEPWVSVPRLESLPEPTGLEGLKAEVVQRYGMIDLLDVLKEADHLTDLTTDFSSVATRETIPREVLRRRLLLVLFSLGTNMGIRRIVATGEHGESEAALRHVRRHFVTRDNLRRAIARLVNATLTARDPGWWGAGTACAPDFQALWGLGFQPAHGVACPRWRSRGDNLLAPRAQERLHPLAVEELLGQRGGGDAGGTPSPLHRRRDRGQLRGQPRGQPNRVRLHPPARFRLLPRLKNIGAIQLYRPDDEASYPGLEAVLRRPARRAEVSKLIDQPLDPEQRLTACKAELEQHLTELDRALAGGGAVRIEDGERRRRSGRSAGAGPPTSWDRQGAG
jgi:hypothetical protein